MTTTAADRAVELAISEMTCASRAARIEKGIAIPGCGSSGFMRAAVGHASVAQVCKGVGLIDRSPDSRCRSSARWQRAGGSR